MNLTCVGFWLPCGHTNFFDLDMDAAVISRQGASVDIAKSNKPSLDDRVIRRLQYVLKTRDYSLVSQITHSSSVIGDGRYPDAVVYLHQNTPSVTLTLEDANRSTNETRTIANWKSNVTVDHVMFLTNASGYTYLIAAHDARQLHADVVEALKTHVAGLFGGTFYSHFSGREEDLHSSDESETRRSFAEYEQFNLGILNFYQLNAIIEGLFNSNFHPSVFFQEREQQDERATAVASYSLAAFSRLITVSITSIDPQQYLTLYRTMVAARNVDQKDTDECTRKLLALANSKLSNEHVLSVFFRATSFRCLRLIKLMIERCRRALLGKMLEVTHRQQRLLQAESPSATAVQVLAENEWQLRGYVMLISAKLPVINNINNHLEELSEHFDKSAYVMTAKSTWIRLLASITDNVHEIENAMQQARLDRLLYELLQIRAQQETNIELNHVRTRFGLTPSGVSSVWEIPNVLGTWLGVAVAVFGSVVSYWLAPQSSGFPLRSNAHEFLFSLAITLFVSALVLLGSVSKPRICL